MNNLLSFRRASARRQKPGSRERGICKSVRDGSAQLRSLPKSELAKRTNQLREQLIAGDEPDSDAFLTAGFSLVNEALRRVMGFEFYDTQLFAGIALTRGSIAEMQTGEGKTVVAALPAYIHGLSGAGVHVATVNSYLAARDFEILSPVFEILGLTAGLIEEDAEPDDKRAAYSADVTYGTGYDFGFDYLRDQSAMRNQSRGQLGEQFRSRLCGTAPTTRATMQRGLKFAIIDEVDSVLIDDATSPLVISEFGGETAPDADAWVVASKAADSLAKDTDYTFEVKTGEIKLTSGGFSQVHENMDSIPLSLLERPWSEYIEQTLRARLVFRRDAHYVVDDGEVKIVDESTGRIHGERKWRGGLHQAVEAKEGVIITPEQLPLARITRQRFYRLYTRLCGMTGTAVGCEREFREFFDLPVIEIPLRAKSKRKYLPARQFTTIEQKWDGVIREVSDVHATGRPILVGTRTIAASEALAQRLEDRGIAFRLLNGRQDEEEADIVGQSGQKGAVTIATNMAGRGTDIRVASEEAELGGLHVIGTERHESQRVDRQLIGRGARQGDPGSARFFVSAEDDLVCRHRLEMSTSMKRSADSSGRIRKDYTKDLDALQRSVETKAFEMRRNLLASDRDRDVVMDRLAGAS